MAGDGPQSPGESPSVLPALTFVPPAADEERGTAGWQLLYFDAPTRGEQLRLLFLLAGVPFEDTRLAWPAGLNRYKRAALGDASPLMFDQVPVLRTPRGTFVSQTAACMQYLGRELGLAPADAASDARALALLLGAEELRDRGFYALLGPSVVARALRVRGWGLLGWLAPLVLWWSGSYHVMRVDLPRRLAMFEAQLPETGTGYLCGSDICYADVAVFDAVRETLALLPAASSSAAFAACPKLASFLRRLEAHPAWAAYLHERGFAGDVLFQAHLMPKPRPTRNADALAAPPAAGSRSSAVAKPTSERLSNETEVEVALA